MMLLFQSFTLHIFGVSPYFWSWLKASYERSYSTDENLTDQLSFNQQGIFMRFYGYGTSLVF